MILSGPEIIKRRGKEVIIEPFSSSNVNANSYNLHLHNQLMVYRQDVLDMKKQAKTEIIEIPKQGLILHPGQLYLGRTVEYTETHNLVPMLEGRSSIGRLGMAVHITAGFGDVGFQGFWTLEIFVLQKIRIYAEIPVCQIFYHTVVGTIQVYQSKKYQKNKGIQPSFLYQEFIE